MSDDFNTIENTEVIPGIISAVASFAVCLTVAIFPQLRSLRYIELVFYVSVNDLIASVGIALGKTQDGSFACWFQGIVTNYNYLSAIMWSTVIMYQVYLIVCKRGVIKDLTGAHILCWGLPLVVTLLPLSTNTYANDDANSGWCFIGNRSNSPSWGLLFWFIVAYYLWVWIAIMLNIIFMCGIVYKLYRMQEIPQRVRATVRKLLLYPIIISLCWGPEAVWDIYNQVHDVNLTKAWTIFDGLSTISSIAEGFLFTCVFFGFNTTVRNAWMDLFVSLGCTACASRERLESIDGNAVSMVSVSGSGGSSLGTHEMQATSTRRSDFEHGARGSTAPGAVSWYARPQSIAQIQEEDDFIPAGDVRLSQRMSILDFLVSDPVAVRTASGTTGVAQRPSFLAGLSYTFNHSISRASHAGRDSESVEHGVNPMVGV
jgi:hypothetical protein